jgi:hypothetical protein
MLVQVATRSFENAKELVLRLTQLFGKECVYARADGEVELQVHGSPNGALIHTLETVEDWLGQTALRSVDVCVDGRSYRVDQPAAGRGPARRA